VLGQGFSDFAGIVVRFWNNIVYDWTGGGGGSSGAILQGGGQWYIHNNTFHNCTKGIDNDTGVAASCWCKNNLFQDCTDGVEGSTNTSSVTNASDISSDLSSGQSQTGEATFVDEGNDDFHLSGSDTVAKDNGTDLSGDANLALTDDIDGATRSGTWDIGADEITAVELPPLVVVLGEPMVGSSSF
jgi:hypothetical protein